MKVLGQEVPAHVVESAERWMLDEPFNICGLRECIFSAWHALLGVGPAIRQHRTTDALASRLTQKHRKLGNLKCEGRVWSWVGGS